MKSFIMAAGGWLAAMTLLSQSGPFGNAPLMFSSRYLLGFACMVLAVRHCPRQLSLSRVAAVAMGLGLLGRFFLWSFPAGNDIYRYICEGYIQLYGANPYQMAPDDPALAHLIHGDMASIWPYINHKDLSAAYPPLVILIFKPYRRHLLSLKTAVLSIDFSTLRLLAWLLRSRRLPGTHLFWYAFNTLVLVYVAGEGHLDSVQADFLMIGLCVFCVNKPFVGFLSTGAAAISKYFSAVALSFVIQRPNRRAWPAASAVLLLFMSFADDPRALFGSLFVFGTQMHWNDALAEMLRFSW